MKGEAGFLVEAFFQGMGMALVMAVIYGVVVWWRGNREKRLARRLEKRARM